ILLESIGGDGDEGAAAAIGIGSAHALIVVVVAVGDEVAGSGAGAVDRSAATGAVIGHGACSEGDKGVLGAELERGALPRVLVNDLRDRGGGELDLGLGAAVDQ